jgi:hypothetical protein
LCKRNKVIHNSSQVFTISSLKEISELFKMKPVLLCCISLWIWCASFLGFGLCNVSCKVGGLKYNGSSLLTNSFTISKSVKFL